METLGFQVILQPVDVWNIRTTEVPRGAPECGEKGKKKETFKKNYIDSWGQGSSSSVDQGRHAWQ